MSDASDPSIPLAAAERRNSSASLRRGIAILHAVARLYEVAGQGSTIQTLVKETGLARSTLHRLLAPLIDTGLVQRVDANYYIGPYAAYLGGIYLEQLDLRATARPHLEALTEQTGETAHLLLPVGKHVTYIDAVESRASLRMHSQIGGRIPMHCTSAGKALLAHLPEDVVNEVVSTGLHRRTPKTIVDGDELRRVLVSVRQLGYAVDDSENETGIRSIGAPVFGKDNAPVAAITISGPENRLTESRVPELGRIVAREAKLLSERLGAHLRLSNDVFNGSGTTP